jgi:hypothetical protein
MTFKTVNSIAFYLRKGAKQYGLLYLAVKRCKGCRKILALWNAKRQEIMSFVSTNKLLLNYESWKVDADNLVRFGTKGIYANNLELSKKAALGYSHSLNRPMLWQLTSRILIWRR